MNKYEIFIHPERVSFLQEALGEKLVVLSEELTGYGNIKVEVTINDEMDVLHIFHAGIMHGNESMRKALVG